MSDRVPLEQVTDKPEPTEETPPTPNPTLPDMGLTEMQDLNDLSIMMGFERGFDGLGKEAEAIYSWAKDNNPDDPLGAIKTAIDVSGISDQGRELIIKLNRWISLDSRMMELQRRKDRIK